MPGDPLVVTAWYRMGEARLRIGMFGRLVLEVAEGRRRGRATMNGTHYCEGIEVRWRKASVYDVAGLDRVAPISDLDRMPPAGPQP